MARASGIYGLSGSGMDVDDMVKKMMQAHQARYDKMYKNKTRVSWQKTEYNNFYKSMETFRFNTLSNYKLQSSMAAKSATSADETIVKAKANGDAVEMEHDIKVTQLAKNAYLQSDKITRMDKDGNLLPDSKSRYLKDIMGTKMPDEPTAPRAPKEPTLPTEPTIPSAGEPQEVWDKYYADKAQYDIDKAQYDIDKPQYDLDKAQYDIDKPIYDAKMVIYNEELDKTAISFRIGDGSLPSDEEDKVLTYTYRDLLDASFTTLATDINNLGLNLNASYDVANDSFSINNRTGGPDNKISFSAYTGGVKGSNGPIPGLTDQADIDRTQTLFNNLQLAEYDAANSKLGTPLKLTATDLTASVQGQGAKATIDGKDYTSNDNHITAGGVTYTVNKIGDTKTTVTGDVDKVVENVKKFVEDYNKMIDSLNKSIHQEEYKTYLPLTDAERSEMTEEQIKKWEEKAKSGLLKNDSILKEVVNDMRSALSRPISGIGKYNSLANIGVTTTSNFKDYGKIELDEKKLREVLKEDPNAAYNVLAASTADYGTTLPDGSTKLVDSKNYNENGVINRLSTGIKKSMDKIVLRAGLSNEEGDDDQTSVLGTTLASMNEKMRRFQKQMEAYEDRLYKQFNAMETAIASLNSQSSFVSNYFSS